MERIFIQVASYRDPQTGPTITDLLEKAQHPERLRFGVCLQTQPGDDIQLPADPRISVIRVDARQSLGTCWARAQCQSLYQGEEFTLQIDSHMRAEPGWDTALEQSWRRSGSPMAVLSHYAPGCTLESDGQAHFDRSHLPVLAAREFNECGVLSLVGINRYPTSALPERPVPGAFISGHLLFGPGQLIADCPYDPQLYFYGEEITLAVRLWTHGYDIYSPDRVVLYHQYKAPGHNHVTHWADHPDWGTLNDRSLQRVQHLLQGHDLGDYGIGTRRSLGAYQRFCGIDFRSRTIQPKALEARFG